MKHQLIIASSYEGNGRKYKIRPKPGWNEPVSGFFALNNFPLTQQPWKITTSSNLQIGRKFRQVGGLLTRQWCCCCFSDGPGPSLPVMISISWCTKGLWMFGMILILYGIFNGTITTNQVRSKTHNKNGKHAVQKLHLVYNAGSIRSSSLQLEFFFIPRCHVKLDLVIKFHTWENEYNKCSPELWQPGS